MSIELDFIENGCYDSPRNSAKNNAFTRLDSKSRQFDSDFSDKPMLHVTLVLCQINVITFFQLQHNFSSLSLLLNRFLFIFNFDGR